MPPPKTQWHDAHVNVLPFAEGELARLEFGPAEVGRVRDLVGDLVAQLVPQRANDAALAVHEIAVNSIVHGAGHGSLRVWSADGELVFEVADPDGKATVPAIVHAAPGDLSGRGLWLAQRLTDALAIHSTADGTVVQMRLRMPSRPGATRC
jgi:anti-sigma regulatory factor (Ser/Thr protein kinase)